MAGSVKCQVGFLRFVGPPFCRSRLCVACAGQRFNGTSGRLNRPAFRQDSAPRGTEHQHDGNRSICIVMTNEMSTLREAAAMIATDPSAGARPDGRSVDRHRRIRRKKAIIPQNAISTRIDGATRVSATRPGAAYRRKPYADRPADDGVAQPAARAAVRAISPVNLAMSAMMSEPRKNGDGSRTIAPKRPRRPRRKRRAKCGQSSGGNQTIASGPAVEPTHSRAQSRRRTKPS